MPSNKYGATRPVTVKTIKLFSSITLLIGLHCLLIDQSRATPEDISFETLISRHEEYVKSLWSLSLKYEGKYKAAGQDDFKADYWWMPEKKRVDKVFQSGAQVKEIVNDGILKSFSLPSELSKKDGYVARATLTPLSGKPDQYLLSMPHDINWMGLFFVSNDDGNVLPVHMALKTHKKEMLFIQGDQGADFDFKVFWSQPKSKTKVAMNFSKKHAFLVNKIEYFNLSEGIPHAKTEITQFSEIQPGQFFPKEIVTSVFNNKINAYHSVLVTVVNDVVVNEAIPDSIFSLRLPKGVEVYDLVQKKIWISNAEGEFDRLATDEDGRVRLMGNHERVDIASNTLTDPTAKPRQNFSGTSQWLFMFFLVILMIPLIFFLLQTLGHKNAK